MYAVPEGYQHAVCGGVDGGRGRGALEPPQTYRTPSTAGGRRPARPVSHLIYICPELLKALFKYFLKRPSSITKTHPILETSEGRSTTGEGGGQTDKKI